MHPRVVDYLSSVEPGSFRVTRKRDPGMAADVSWRSGEGGKIARFADHDGGEVYEIQFDQKAIAQVTIDLNRMEVEKKIGRYGEYGIYQRELLWLERLQGSGIAPEVIAHSPNDIVMSYVGEPVRPHNLPADWREQADAILRRLREHGCCHNDIKCDNLTVLQGRLYLVDFGWATEAGAPISPNWPTGIGRQHRLAIHRFDDRHAIHAALDSAERGEVDHSIVMSQ